MRTVEAKKKFRSSKHSKPPHSERLATLTTSTTLCRTLPQLRAHLIQDGDVAAIVYIKQGSKRFAQLQHTHTYDANPTI